MSVLQVEPFVSQRNEDPSDHEQFEPFDDSDADPDFTVSTEDNSEDYDTDSSIDKMAKEIEYRMIDDNLPEDAEKTELSNDSRKTRKLKRNMGKAYKTSKGKIVPRKTFTILSKCFKNCKLKISPQDQEAIFNQFWDLSNFNLRVAFTSGIIDIQDKKTTYNIKSTAAPRNRVFSYKYFLNVNGQRVNICQKCFKNTLAITDRFIKTVINKKIDSAGIVTLSDQRGKSTPPNKLSAEKKNEVLNHIKSFPAYESHYTRKNTSKLYLQSDLNLALMYRLYTQVSENPVSLSMYSTIFKELNIQFKKPKLDTCTKCDILKRKLEVELNETVKNTLKEEQLMHHTEADLAYELKKKDIAVSKEDQSYKVFTFDLQQCLPTPFIQSSMSFYKRQLHTFNLTIHDCTDGTPNCYLWHEAIAKRGGNEIALCLYQHLKNITPPFIKFLTFYSDNCFGQNKNGFVATMFAIFVSNSQNIEYIDHKFLISGHTHMECDVDHSVIERKKKKTTFQIHHPRDWAQFIRTVGTKTQFLVHEMIQSDFLDFSAVQKSKFTFRNVDDENNTE